MKDHFRKSALLGLTELLCRVPLIFTAGFLARCVGPEAFGAWAVILVTQGVAAIGIGLGLSSALSRLASVCDAALAYGYLRFGLSVIALLGTIALAVLLQLHTLLGLLLHIPAGYEELLPLAMLLAVASTADGLFDAYFKARGYVGRQMLFLSLRTAAEILAVVTVFAFGWPGEGSAPSRLAHYAMLLAGTKLLAYPWLLVGQRDRTGLRRKQKAELIRYGLPMMPAALVVWLVGQGDRLVLARIVEQQALGVYAFAATLAGYLVFLGYAVYPLLLPQASRYYEAGDLAAVERLFHHSQRLFLTLLAPALAFLALFGGEVLALTAGPDYLDGAPMLLLLGCSVGLEQVFGVYQYVFHLTKKTQWILWLNSGTALLLLAAVAAAAVWGGIGWVPWAVLATTLVANGIRYGCARRQLRIVLSPRLVAVAGALPAAAVALAYHAPADFTSRLGLAVPLAAVALYAAASAWRATLRPAGSRRPHPVIPDVL